MISFNAPNIRTIISLLRPLASASTIETLHTVESEWPVCFRLVWISFMCRMGAFELIVPTFFQNLLTMDYKITIFKSEANLWLGLEHRCHDRPPNGGRVRLDLIKAAAIAWPIETLLLARRNVHFVTAKLAIIFNKSSKCLLFPPCRLNEGIGLGDWYLWCTNRFNLCIVGK